MHWECLRAEPLFELRRAGRFLVAELEGAASRDEHLGAARRPGRPRAASCVNHQSCEGTAHLDRHRVITEAGLEAYHDRVCAEIESAARPDRGHGNRREHELRGGRARGRRRRIGDGRRHRRRRGQRDRSRRAGDLARDGRGHAEGAGLRRHHQHHAAHQPSADAGSAGAGGRDDDGRQERRAAAAGRAEQAAHRSGHRHRHRSVLHRRAGRPAARCSPRRVRT